MTERTRKLSSISVNDVGFFEGAEKLLEVWFYLGPEGSPKRPQNSVPGAKKGLRVIPRYVK